MSLDAAVTLALAEGIEAAADAERRRGPGESSYGLTPREREVAVRIARGLTNRQMASEFALAERTVDVHVSNILSKLQLSSRAQVAAWVVKNDWLGEADALLEDFEARDRALAAVTDVVLWFEHDLYDQLQLLQVVTLLDAHDAARTADGVGKDTFRLLADKAYSHPSTR